MGGQTGLASHVGGWLFAGGLGLLAGDLVGLGMMGSHTHAIWPALAGFVLGVAGPLAAPTRHVLVALFSGGVAVVSALATIVSVQLQRGHWPITHEFAVAHYGTAAQATMRAAVMLGAGIGVPCLAAAALIAVAQRRHDQAAQPGAAAGEPRGEPQHESDPSRTARG